MVKKNVLIPWTIHHLPAFIVFFLRCKSTASSSVTLNSANDRCRCAGGHRRSISSTTTNNWPPVTRTRMAAILIGIHIAWPARIIAVFWIRARQALPANIEQVIVHSVYWHVDDRHLHSIHPCPWTLSSRHNLAIYLWSRLIIEVAPLH